MKKKTVGKGGVLKEEKSLTKNSGGNERETDAPSWGIEEKVGALWQKPTCGGRRKRHPAHMPRPQPGRGTKASKKTHRTHKHERPKNDRALQEPCMEKGVCNSWESEIK